MKFFIPDKLISFYKENGFIEFEDIISLEQSRLLEKELDKTIDLKNDSSIDLIKKGRDHFRKSPVIKKLIFNKNFLNIVKNLTKKESFRIVFDQAFYSKGKNLFAPIQTLNDISSFQGLLGFIIFKLDDNSSKQINYFPEKRTNAVFLNSSFPLEFEKIYEVFQKFFIIAYGNVKTIYKLNIKDPNVNFLKQFGYNFGDMLKDEFHPTIF